MPHPKRRKGRDVRMGHFYAWNWQLCSAARDQTESHLLGVEVMTARTAADDAVVPDLEIHDITASAHAGGIELPDVSGWRSSLGS